jgi:hypothetical protein
MTMLVSLHVMQSRFDKIDAAARVAIAATIVEETNNILRTALSIRGLNTDKYQLLLDDLATRVDDALDASDYAYGKKETMALILALSSSQTSPVVSMINDMMEILFVERRMRSEYIDNRNVAPPYVINKLLLEYALKSRRVDALVGRLNKDFCATRCDKPPVGCCSTLGYDMGVIPQRMLEVQELEATRNGWQMPPHPDLNKCRYHTVAGCVLSLFKTPYCIGYLCEGIEKFFEENYTEARLAVFYKELKAFNRCEIDRSNVFKAMDRLVDAGGKL